MFLRLGPLRTATKWKTTHPPPYPSSAHRAPFAFLQEPIVIDAELLRANPEGVLREVSEMVGIPYASEQLSWEAGPKPYDGCWAYVW